MRLFRVPPMSDAEATKWAATRARGRRRYILMVGVLGWGIFMAFSGTILKHLLFDPPGPFLRRLALALVVFSLGGTWFGQKTWTEKERRYLAWRQRSGEAPIDHG